MPSSDSEMMSNASNSDPWSAIQRNEELKLQAMSAVESLYKVYKDVEVLMGAPIQCFWAAAEKARCLCEVRMC